jgi:hypothetical protein
MKTMYSTSYSDSDNQTSKEIQDIVKRVSDSVSVMIEKQMSSIE